MSLEERRFEFDVRTKDEELELKRRELELHAAEFKRANSLSERMLKGVPLILPLFVAALTLGSALWKTNLDNLEAAQKERRAKDATNRADLNARRLADYRKAIDALGEMQALKPGTDAWTAAKTKFTTARLIYLPMYQDQEVEVSLEQVQHRADQIESMSKAVPNGAQRSGDPNALEDVATSLTDSCGLAAKSMRDSLDRGILDTLAEPPAPEIIASLDPIHLLLTVRNCPAQGAILEVNLQEDWSLSQRYHVDPLHAVVSIPNAHPEKNKDPFSCRYIASVEGKDVLVSWPEQ